MLTRRTVILAKEEATYGTDPSMTGTDGILAFDVDIDIKGEMLERDVLRDTLTPLPHVIGMKEASLTFKTEMKGAGISGTSAVAPEFHSLLRGCGFATAAITGTDLTYGLLSSESDIVSVAFKVYKDGNLHKIVGSRGNVKFVLEAGKFGVMEYEFSGKYTAVAADTIPDISGLVGGTALPPVVYNASFNIGEFSPVCSRAQLDIGNSVVRRDSLNATYGVEAFRITERKGKLEFDADAVVEASNPFWGDWASDVVDTYGVTVGSVVGNKMWLYGNFQYDTNKYGDADGVSKYDCVASLCASNSETQNDEFKISFC